MQIAVIVLSCIAPVLVVLGYLLGRYQASLLNRIRTLAQPEAVAEPEVTLGAYTPPETVIPANDGRPVGLAETKTAEQLEWEAAQELERKVKLGVS